MRCRRGGKWCVVKDSNPHQCLRWLQIRSLLLCPIKLTTRMGARLLLPPAGRGRLGVSLNQVRAVVGSSWFCSAYGSRLSDRPRLLHAAVETRAAPSKAKWLWLTLLLVELGGVEPPSSSLPLSHPGSVSACHTIMFTAGRRKPSGELVSYSLCPVAPLHGGSLRLASAFARNG